MAATTTTGAWQTPVTQYPAPDIDVTGAADVGQAEAQTTMNAATAVGYFGYSPADESS